LSNATNKSENAAGSRGNYLIKNILIHYSIYCLIDYR